MLRFLFVTLLVTFALSQCTFSIPPQTLTDIRTSTKKATFLRLIIKDHVSKNLSTSDFFVSKSTSLFLLEPSSSFYTFGLIARDFYVVDVTISGGFCNTTNGINTPRKIDRDMLFMSTVFNTSISGQPEKKFLICSPEVGNLPLPIAPEPLKNYFSLRKQEYLCCDDQKQCSVQTEPFVNQVSEWIISIFGIILACIFVQMMISRTYDFHNKTIFDDYVTNNFTSPVSPLTAFIPKFRSFSRLGSFILQLVLLYGTLFAFSFTYAFAPIYWQNPSDNNAQFRGFEGGSLILAFLMITILSIVKISFPIQKSEKNPSRWIMITKVFIIFCLSLVINLIWIPFIYDDGISITSTTKSIICILGTVYYFNKIGSYKFIPYSQRDMIINSLTPLKEIITQKDHLKFYGNLFMSYFLEGSFLLFSFIIAYFASLVMGQILWYNMVAIILYPSNIALYSAALAIVFIFNDFLAKIVEPYGKVKQLMVKKACKNWSDIQVEDRNEDKKKYSPVTWEIFFNLCSEINFRSLELEALRQLIIQVTIISLFFMGIMVFVPDTWDGVLQLGLTVLIPIIPKLSGIIILTSQSSTLESTIFEARFEKAFAKMEDQLNQYDVKDIETENFAPKLSLVVVHEEMGIEEINL